MTMTEAELFFLRLRDRTKKLSSEELSRNIRKMPSASLLLEQLYSKMCDEKNVDEMQLIKYRKDVYELKEVVEVHNKKSCEESISQLNRIPHGFPNIAPLDPSRGRDLGHSHTDGPISSSTSLRARSKAFYQADMRRQLLGDETKREEGLSRERQDELAGELLRHTHSLKRNLTVTGEKLKEDNKRLVQMQSDVDKNREKLSVEGRRLARHAYSCAFDCMIIFVAVFVFWSFIAMVILIKVFPKPR